MSQKEFYAFDKNFERMLTSSYYITGYISRPFITYYTGFFSLGRQSLPLEDRLIWGCFTISVQIS